MKKFLKLILVGMMALMLIACGSEESEAVNEEVKTEESETTEEIEAVEEIVELEYDYIEEDEETICLYDVGSSLNTLPETITLPEEIDGKTVVSIKELFSNDSRGQKEIIIPSSVKNIKEDAFTLANTIEKITVCGCETIKADAIYMCESLKVLQIEEGTKTIEDNTGYLCPSLEEVYLPASVEYISDSGCFLGTSQNLTIYAPAGSYAEEWAVQMGFKVEAR